MLNRCTPIVAFCLATVATTVLADNHDKVMKKFIGAWNIDEGVNKGERIPEEELENAITVITKDTITSYDADRNVTYQAKYELDTQTDPMQIDMVSQRQGKEFTALGIVQFDTLDLDGEDEFQLAYSLKEGERPKKFESPKGSAIIHLELEQAELDD